VIYRYLSGNTGSGVLVKRLTTESSLWTESGRSSGSLAGLNGIFTVEKDSRLTLEESTMNNLIHGPQELRLGRCRGDIECEDTQIT